jgi:hypothetical protein
MKYNQPYGISDPNAPYINGNPSTGTMGSIPPAASIEYPQRELVNFIGASALTPANTDLYQLAKAVQSGRVNYGLDGGEPNKIYVTPTLPVSAYTVGLHLVIKVSYGNTSAVSINVSGLGYVPLIHTDLTPLIAYELRAGQLILVAYDGANFQCLAGANPGVVVLSAPAHLYVNDITGSDTLYDGTSAVVSGVMGGPFKTIQKALEEMRKYNLGGWDFYIHVADGNYNSTAILAYCPVPNGSGIVHLVGNESNPAACNLYNTGTGSAIAVHKGGQYDITGFSIRTTAPNSSDGAHGCWVMYGSYCRLGVMRWNSCVGSHFNVGTGATGSQYLHQYIAGSAASHQNVYTNGIMINANPDLINPPLTITAAVSLPQFATASGGGQMWSIWGAITGAGNVTGTKYIAFGNGVIDVQGRGVSYLPGTVAGYTATGGQYL